MSRGFMSQNFKNIPCNVHELKLFSWKSIFWPRDPYMTFEGSGVMWHKWEVTLVPSPKFDENRSLYARVMRHQSVARRKKELESNSVSRETRTLPIAYFECWINMSPCTWQILIFMILEMLPMKPCVYVDKDVTVLKYIHQAHLKQFE